MTNKSIKFFNTFAFNLVNVNKYEKNTFTNYIYSIILFMQH